MGVYGFTLHGEPLPPLYILSTSLKSKENFAFNPLIGDGLLILMAKYAQDKIKSYPSRVAVWSKRSMGTGLWEQLCRDLYIPCYENKIAPEPLHDPVAQKLHKAPLIKAVIIMANNRVVFEAHRRLALLAEKERDDAVQKKNDKEQQFILESVDAFHRWLVQGKQIINVAGNSYLILIRKDAVAIVRVLLPQIDIVGQLKMKEFSTANACLQ